MSPRETGAPQTVRGMLTEAADVALMTLTRQEVAGPLTPDALADTLLQAFQPRVTAAMAAAVAEMPSSRDAVVHGATATLHTGLEMLGYATLLQAALLDRLAAVTGRPAGDLIAEIIDAYPLSEAG